MLYLFNNSSAEQPSVTKNIWLTGKGITVFATEISSDFRGATGQGARLVGSIDADNAASYQLSKGTELTESGKSYCAVMGVEPSVESLAKFVERAKQSAVKVDAIVAPAPTGAVA